MQEHRIAREPNVALMLLLIALGLLGIVSALTSAQPAGSSSALRTQNSELLLTQHSALFLSFHFAYGDSAYDLPATEAEIVRLACTLRGAGYAGYRLKFAAMIDIVDQEGIRDGLGDAGLTVTLSPDAPLDCEHPALVDLAAVGEDYHLHEALRSGDK